MSDQDGILFLMRKLQPLSCMGVFTTYDCCNPCCWQCIQLPKCIMKWILNKHDCQRKPSESKRFCSGARDAYQALVKGMLYED